MRLHLLAAPCALLALWLSCLPAGPDAPASSAAGVGGTPLPTLCQAACEKKYPNGVMPYQTFHNCLVCGACHDSCTGQVPCDGAEKGCSAKFKSCAECAASSCAAQQQPDTTFQGACAAEGTACSKNSDCVALDNCIAKCIVTTGPGGTGGHGGAGTAASSSSSK